MEEAEFDSFGPRPQSSVLMLIVRAVGLRNGAMLLLVNLAVFIAIAILLRYGKNRSQGPAILSLLTFPFLLTAFSALSGVMNMFQVISLSGVSPKASEMAEGYVLFTISSLVSILMATPSILLASIGLFVQALLPDRTPTNLPPKGT